MKTIIKTINFVSFVSLFGAGIAAIVAIRKSLQAPITDETTSMSNVDLIWYYVAIFAAVELFVLLLYGITKRYLKKESEHTLQSEINHIALNHKQLFTISAVILLIVLIMAGLSYAAKLVLFHPSYDVYSDDYLSNNPAYDRVVIQGQDDYTGWLRKGSSHKTIVYFGGNAESSAARFKSLDDCDRWDVYGKYNYLMVDYPGYGISQGTPSENSIKDMIDATMSYVQANDDLNQEIVLMGYSMGTGASIYAASGDYNVSRIILVAPYDDMKNVFNTHLNIFHGPVARCLPLRFDMKQYYNKGIKTLILASKNDSVIPYKSSTGVAEKMDNSVLVEIPNVSHGEIIGCSDTLEEIKMFLNR